MNNYPIVLAHGIARFDFLLQRLSEISSRLGIPGLLPNDRLHYFKGIAGHLRAEGFNVFHSSVSFAAGVKRRASDLKSQVELALSLQPGQDRVHIIGHSMGGLDARHMIVELGMAEKVASLTTIGTPHNGTSFADWGIAHKGDAIIRAVSTAIDLGGFADLTTDACRAFNESAQESEASTDVVYQVYSATQPVKQVFGPLKAAWKIINAVEGANDGLVSGSSQLWQTELTGRAGSAKTIHQHTFPVSADHLNEIGWWDIDQIRLSDLLDGNLVDDAKRYELQIRNVYLDIARSVQLLPT